MKAPNFLICLTAIAATLYHGGLAYAQNRFTDFNRQLLIARGKQFSAAELSTQFCLDDSAKTRPPLRTITPYLGQERTVNAAAAFAMSIFPGAVIHGTGLLYVGDTKTAKRVIELEAVSVLIMVGSSVIATEGTNVPGIIGMTLFAGSWVYDIAMTQVRVDDHRIENAMRQIRPALNIANDRIYCRVGVRI